MTFRDFIGKQVFPHELREGDAGAAPMSGMGDSGGGDETHNSVKKYSSDALDMDEEEYEAGEQGNAFTLYRMYKFPGWPFLVRPPVQVTVEPMEDSPGMNKVTFLLSLKKPNAFYHPYRQGEIPVRFKTNGPIEDKTEEMSDQDVDNMRAQYADPKNQKDAQAVAQPAPGAAGGPQPMAAMRKI
jgi:hypothetical protein